MKNNITVRLLILVVLSTSLVGCSKSSKSGNSSRATGWQINAKEGGFQYNTNFKEQETAPGLVFVEGGTFTMGKVQDDVMHDWNNSPNQQHVQSFYMDETEVTNMMYLEYLDWIKRVYPPSEPKFRAIYNGAVPDTLVWRNRLGYSEMMVDNYLRHPAFKNYPVVGVSWMQAVEFANWRSDRVAEMGLQKEGYLEKDSHLTHTTADSNFNINTGESDAPLFRFRIRSDSYPIYTKIWFRASLLSPSLGLDSRETLTEIESNVFQMKEDIIIDNRNFSTNTNTLLDEGNPPNVVPVVIRTIDAINPSDFELVTSAMMSTGKLADGEYRFELKIYSGSSEFDIQLTDQDSKTIIVESSSGVNLESPGGELSDSLFNVVYTPYPIFNWNKGNCKNCFTYIRIAEFKNGYHSSMEEALRDERMLPYNQSLEWFNLSDISTFQYPTSDARPLEYGKTYVWQIKVEIPTTNGYEDELSSVYAFKLADPSESASIKMLNSSQQSLIEALGEDQYNALFGIDGPLAGYRITKNIIINNSNVNQNILNQILSKMSKKEILINSVTVEK